MFDIIKNSLFTGLGMAVVAKDKLEKATKKLVEEGKLSQEEAEKLFHDLVTSGEGQWRDIEDKIKKLIQDAIADLDISSKSEVEELRKRVEELEKLVKKEQ